MQVAHQTDNITHAVLGGKTDISFGISDDPAFFQILSSALYKDPMLAMVRETICNAWDAHIDSGCVDTPLTITLDDEHLIIRDYGKGIPDALIGPIYGVYGASTKKKDGRQTGGFGLGCKSPFAYTDHFEVISHHEGVRTIYRMSKSSAEKMGKPSIVPIASFPTEETGIQVKIPLKGGAQDQRLSSLVRQVVFNGDIKANYNDELLETIGLCDAESGFILINNAESSMNILQAFNDHNIHVRYGNVIYPVESSSEINALWMKINNMLQNVYQCRLVLSAPADSISVTPSRESLTMSEITVETLKTLMSKFLAHLMQNRELSHRYEEMTIEYIDKAAADVNYSVAAKLLFNGWTVPGIPEQHSIRLLKTTEDLALMEVLLRYNGRSGKIKAGKWLEFMGRYLTMMVQEMLLDRGLVQSWLADAKRIKKFMSSPNSGWEYHRIRGAESSEVRTATRWWQQRIALPLVQKILKTSSVIKVEKISYVSRDVLGAESVRGIRQPRMIKRVKIDNHTSNLKSLLTPTLVLCHNGEIITKRVGRLDLDQKVGAIQLGDYFVLELPRVKDVVESVVPLLEALDGVHVIDLTKRMPHEEEAYQERLNDRKVLLEAQKKLNPAGAVSTSVIKKPKPGLVTMKNLITKSNSLDTTLFTTLVDPERTLSPSFIAKVSLAADKTGFTDEFGPATSVAIARLWGDEGAVTNNSAFHAKQVKKGIMNISAFVVDKVVNEISTNPDIKEYMSFDPEKVGAYLHSHTGYHKAADLVRLYDLFITVPDLHTVLPNFTPLSEENQLRLIVWRDVVHGYTWRNTKEIKDAAEEIKDVELSPEVKKLLDEMIINPFLDIIDQDELKNTFIKQRGNPVVMKKLASIIQSFLN